MKKLTSYLIPASILVSSITAILFLLNSYQLIILNTSFFTAFRAFNVILLLLLAAHRRSLTIWILISIIAGAEFGYDFPEISKNMQFLSDIFLRLIKTIIAPLIFATLVNGIASHNDLKLIGRCKSNRSWFANCQ